MFYTGKCCRVSPEKTELEYVLVVSMVGANPHALTGKAHSRAYGIGETANGYFD